MAAIDEILFQMADAYASRHRIKIARRLGFGIHGLVLEGERVADAARTAIEVHKEGEPYHRERAIYERLAERVIREIRGFNVPRLINCDEDLRVIEMTVVVRPFVLDFAGAYLEERPDFPEDVWEQWEEEKREQFGTRWPAVQGVLNELENYGIVMADVSPSNIAFLEPADE